MKTKLITLLALAWTILASAQSPYAGFYGGSVNDTTFNDANAGTFAVFVGTDGQAIVVGYDVDSFQNYEGQAGGVAAQFNVPANGNWNFSSNNTSCGVSGSGLITNGSFSETLNFTNGDTVQLSGSQQSPLGSFQNAAGFYKGTFSGNFGGQPVSGTIRSVLSANGQIVSCSFVNGAENDGGQGQFGSNNQFTATNFTSGTVVSGTLTNATLTIGGISTNQWGSCTWTMSRSNYVFGVATTNLPPGTTTVPYSQTMSAYGGPTNYSWGIISGGLPAGLSLSRSGVISGTPTAAVTTNFTVQATNALSVTATQALSLVIYPFSTSQTFAVSPAAVSNTYPGQITLQVSGLIAGGSVVVQKFLDLNTNGVIDNGDLLVQQFNLTDGQAGMAFGGVTNFNVPGDNDGTANEQITAKLNFQTGDFSQNIVGKYLFKVSGNFTPPITNSFTVTNFPWGQKFTGNVVSNSVAIPYAVILLFGPNHGPVAGAVANNSGNYTIAAPVGTYSEVAFKSNFVANMSAAPVLTLAAGQTITNNPALTNATASISGSVVDASNSGIGLPGVLIPAQANGLLAVAYTDTNGNFNVPVTAGNWKIKGDDTTLVVHGYLGLQNDPTFNAGATGVTIAVPKATALIYGSVKDNLGNPFVGLDVYASDQNNMYQTDGYTDVNGNYVLGVLDLGSNDQWWIDANDNDQITNCIFAQETFDGNINAGTAVLQNFTAILATNFITGNVEFNGTNIAGVGVMASGTINDTYYFEYVNADANGNYLLKAANGTWTVSLETSGGNGNLDGILGSGNYQPPGNQTAVINNNNATNNFIIQPCNGVQIMTPSPLPVGEWGVYYDQFITASACGNNYNWSQTGGNLPGGLTFNQNGQAYGLSGNPNNNGTFSFTVQFSDGTHTTNKIYSLTISNAVQVATTSLPDGTSGQNYTQQLQAAAGVPFGGASPYSWTLASDSDNLPANLTLATNGIISGQLAASGTFNFTVEVADSLGGIYDQPLSLYIAPAPPLQVTTTNLPSGTSGGFYSRQLQAIGGVPFGGASPYSWSLSPGSASLPPNLTLATNGVLSGIPTNKGTYSFSVRATDSAGTPADQPLSLVVSGLQVTTTYLLYGTNGVSYSQQLQASGGMPFGGLSPYSWSLSPSSASLPPNLTLATNGVLSGTPSAKGTYSFSVRATDSAGATADQLLSLLIGTPTSSSLFTCKTNNGTITITGYLGGTGAVLIPVTINGWPVTSIGTNAFANDRLTSVTIPGSITNIAYQAFYNCYNLTNATLANGVTTIGSYAFWDCSVLPSITIPGTVTSIGQNAFSGCNALTSVIIANGVTSIGEEAFYQCYYLTNVTIGNSVTSIGDYAFYNCGLASVTIPNSVTNIGNEAFYYCASLNNVAIGNGVTSIGANAFYYCYHLTSVTIPGSVASIGSDAFADCYALTNVIIANGVPCNIGTYAFYDCSSLTSVTIGNGVTNIGSYAFENCGNLTRVTIGNSIASIQDYAFENCASLTSVFFNGNPPTADSTVFLYDDNVTSYYYLPSASNWTDFFATYPAVLWNPQVQTGDASFGVRTNQFGFNITGASGLTLVIEACTNLGDPVWLPVGTNAFTGDSSYFSDPRWTNYPNRFYRFRSP